MARVCKLAEYGDYWSPGGLVRCQIQGVYVKRFGVFIPAFLIPRVSYQFSYTSYFITVLHTSFYVPVFAYQLFHISFLIRDIS